MEYREDLRQCRWLARGQMRRLVGSQDEANKPVQIARGSWPDGGDAQEANVQSRMRFDWVPWRLTGLQGTVQSTPLVPGVIRAWRDTNAPI